MQHSYIRLVLDSFKDSISKKDPAGAGPLNRGRRVIPLSHEVTPNPLSMDPTEYTRVSIYGTILEFSSHDPTGSWTSLRVGYARLTATRSRPCIANASGGGTPTLVLRAQIPLHHRGGQSRL